MAQPTTTATEDDRGTRAEDAEIVRRILDGDRQAMSELYDRYADRIHTMCVHMLGDHHDAADVTGQVILVALQRIHQLREPSKLRAWLFAITRHEVYRRSRQRNRVMPTGEVPETGLDPTQLDAFRSELTAEPPGVDHEALAALVRTASGGLDERDRLVLELNLTQGLEGAELADALGVKLDHAYQLTHRMKERLERSIAALLVVTTGRGLCDELDGVAQKWDGHYDVLWRKRFARHVERCERCGRMRSRLPGALLAGVALSQAAQSAVLAAPISLRRQVLAQAPAVVATSRGAPWSRSGFPGGPGRRRRLQASIATVLSVLVVAGLSGTLADGGLPPEETTTTTATTTPTTVAPSTTSTTIPTTTTVPPSTTTVKASTTTTTTASTTTTTTTTEAPTTTPTTITRATTTTQGTVTTRVGTTTSVKGATRGG